MEKIIVNGNNPYPIYLDKTIIALNEVFKEVDPRSYKVLIVSDSNIPDKNKLELLDYFFNATLYNITPGEDSKNIEEYLGILKTLVNLKFTRYDYIIALGGGVVGDLAGFASATFKRGINFINIPTSSLAMIDSSIGGKTAIDFEGIKNIVGSFYNPKAVIINYDYLLSLPARERQNGFFEALKMGLTLDKNILDAIFQDDTKKIINLSIIAKKNIVEEDAYEKNLRKVLNFGHTIGHAIEMTTALLHGEAIAVGMLYFIKDKTLKVKVKSYIDKYIDSSKVMSELKKIDIKSYLGNDKKMHSDKLDCVVLEKIEKYAFVNYTIDDIVKIVREENE